MFGKMNDLNDAGKLVARAHTALFAVLGICSGISLMLSGCSGGREPAETVPLVDRKGDTGVPKTSVEKIGGDSVVWHESAAGPAGTGAQAVDAGLPDGYSVDAYFTEEETGSTGMVGTDGQGHTIKITRTKNLDISAMDGYGYVYKINSDGMEVSVGSRYGEDYVGRAEWVRDGYRYIAETSQWDEIPLNELGTITGKRNAETETEMDLEMNQETQDRREA